MDALTLLHDDHQRVDALFGRFARASRNASKTKRDIVDRIIRELSIHAAIEEQVFYPAVRSAAPDLSSQVLESLEEHHIVKWLLSELERMSPDNDRFDAKVTVLKEIVQHHVGEEESDLFPKVRRAMPKARLEQLGEELGRAKSSVPDRPHPRLPDEPPGNLITSVAAGVVDVAKSTAGHLVEQVSHVISDSPDEPKELVQKAEGAAKKARRTVAKKTTGGARSARKATKTTAARASRQTSATAKNARKATKKTARKAAKKRTSTAASARKAAKKAAPMARTARQTTKKARKEAAGTVRTARKAAKSATGRTGTRAGAGATRTRRTAKRAANAR
jgi:hemerythrin superfamily protein